MNKKYTMLILGLIFISAILVRVIPIFSQIFSDGTIKFPTVDAYYHMRIVDELVKNFPHRMEFDYYTAFPYGAYASWAPVFSYVIATPAWIIGLGHPSPAMIDTIAVFVPAVLGALVVIPTYFIGKKIFSSVGVGLIASAIIAIVPGEFFGRSLLGSTDHHVLETLLMLCIMLFAILCSGRKYYSWQTILCGIFLALYMLTWAGALLAIVIIVGYILILSIGFGRRVGNFSVVFIISLIATFLWLPAQSKVPLMYAAMIVPAIAVIILDFICSKLKLKLFRIFVMTTIAVIMVGVFFVNREILTSVLTNFGFIFSWDIGTSLFEMQPILFPGRGNFSFGVVWGNFAVLSVIGIISIGILTCIAIKRKDAPIALLILWSIIMLAATLAQRRFAYYYAVNVAILSAFVIWEIVKYAAKESILHKNVSKFKMFYKKNTIRLIDFSVIMIIIIVVVFFPMGSLAIQTAHDTQFVPSEGWTNALNWMRDNTPNPLPEDNMSYYSLIPAGKTYPSSAYGVMAWWDYGHWITRIAHRIPNASPSSYGSAPTFFAITDNTRLYNLTESIGIKYVIIDDLLVTSKFYAIPMLASSKITPIDPEMYTALYYVQNGNKVVPITLYHEGYYKSTAVRLYNFNGQAVTPTSTTVITYENRKSMTGQEYKLITDRKDMPYADAIKFINSQKTKLYKIVGISPFESPIPINAVDRYHLVYSSPGTSKFLSSPEIKIFEYIK